MLQIIEAGILVILAVYCDTRTYKIRNSIILFFVLAGIITNSLLYGISAAAISIAAMLLPVIILFVFYALRMLGAGDIKLFGAIGAVMGIKFVLYTMVYSFLSGGIIALMLIIIRKNGKQRLIHLVNYIKACFLSLSLLPYTDFTDKSDGAKFRFSYAILCGMLISTFMVYN